MTGNIVRPTSARIRPLPPADRDPEAKALIDSFGSSSTDNTFDTLARHPKLLSTWMPFAAHLAVNGELPPRIRELTILVPAGTAAPSTSSASMPPWPGRWELPTRRSPG